MAENHVTPVHVTYPYEADYDGEGGPPQGQPQRTVLDYLQIVKTKLWMILGIAMLVVLATYVYAWHLADPFYSATNTIVIEPAQSRLGRRMLTPQDHNIYFNTQASLLKSLPVLFETAQQASINQWPEYRGLSNERALNELASNITISPQRNTNLAEVTVYARTPQNAQLLSDRLLSIWKRRIDEKHREDRAQATQDIRAAIAERQNEIRSRLTEIRNLQMQIRQVTEEETRMAVEMTRENQLLSQLTQVQLAYQTAVAEFRYFMETQPPSLETIAAGPPSARTLPFVAVLDILNASLPAWETELASVERDYRRNIGSMPLGGAPAAPLTSEDDLAADTPTQQSDAGLLPMGVGLISAQNRVELLEQRLLQVREEIQYYETVYTREHMERDPTVRRAHERLKSQIQALSQAIFDAESENTRLYYNFLLGNVSKLDEQERHLQDRLEGRSVSAERRREVMDSEDLNEIRQVLGQRGVVVSLQERILQSRRIAIDIEAIERAIEMQNVILQALISEEQNIRIEIPDSAYNIFVINPNATTSSDPTRPNKPMFMVMAVVGGLALGTAVALGLTFIDTSVRTPADVRRSLNTPILGFIANMEGQASDFGSRCLIAHDMVRSAAAESFREIRSRLFAMQNQRPFKSILVTSTAPQEGKTTVAANLAISLAHAGRKVLLIDTRLRHPNLHLLFNLDQAPGLNEVLTGETPYGEAIHATEIPGLSVIAGGFEPLSPAEQLGSQAMDALMTDLSAQFDMIVVDGSPVLGISDTLVLSDKVDVALFVIKSAKTNRSVVSRAKASLDDAGIEVLGVVINDVRYSRGDFYYYAKHY